jgi:hypothetical protein
VILKLEPHVDLSDVSSSSAVCFMIRQVQWIVRPAHVRRVQEQLAMTARQSPKVLQRTTQNRQVPHYPNPVTEQEQGVKGARLELEYVNALRIYHAAQAHGSDCLRADVERCDRYPSGLKCQRVQASACADIEHMSVSLVKCRNFNRGEISRRAEEVAHGQRGFESVLSPHREDCLGIPLQVADESHSERFKRFEIHAGAPLHSLSARMVVGS